MQADDHIPITDEVSLDPHHLRADLKMILRAIRNRWHNSEKIVEALPAPLLKIINSPDTAHRDKIRAAETLMRSDQHMQDTLLKIFALMQRENAPTPDAHSIEDDVLGMDSTIKPPGA